jgi:NAD(P)-dependent dehydrogenase (short-subunit alcohol dehydrogenase family)
MLLKGRTMPSHPALADGRVAVVTGAASGIGLAASERFADLGMKLVLVDIDRDALRTAGGTLGQKTEVLPVVCDVGDSTAVELLANQVYDRFGEVAVLMNNAGREGGGELFGEHARWQAILETNLWGVINGIQAFAPRMIAQGSSGAIISTGSKQGITCPPGDTAYNVSKAGVKVATEALAHELRNTEGCKLTAHLLIPGFTYTGFTRVRHSEKPAGAWLPEQVIDLLMEGMANGDFYILCPDNDVTREMDKKRITWAAQDITKNRPPLSRWHPDFKDAFERFMRD